MAEWLIRYGDPNNSNNKNNTITQHHRTLSIHPTVGSLVAVVFPFPKQLRNMRIYLFQYPLFIYAYGNLIIRGKKAKNISLHNSTLTKHTSTAKCYCSVRRWCWCDVLWFPLKFAISLNIFIYTHLLKIMYWCSPFLCLYLSFALALASLRVFFSCFTKQLLHITSAAHFRAWIVAMVSLLFGVPTTIYF